MIDWLHEIYAVIAFFVIGFIVASGIGCGVVFSLWLAKTLGVYP